MHKLTLHYWTSLVLLIGLHFTVDALIGPRQAAPSSTSTPLPPRLAKYRYYSGPWTDEQKQMEADAWDGALLLAESMAKWKPGDNTGGTNGGYQDAMDLYMGKSSKLHSIWPWGYHYAEYIQNNVQGAISVHADSRTPILYSLYVTTQKGAPGKAVGECEKPGVWAVSLLQNGLIWTDIYVVLCDDWFKFPSLASARSQMDGGTLNKSDIRYLMYTRDSIYFHESMHWDGVTVRQPDNLDSVIIVRDEWDGVQIYDPYYIRLLQGVGWDTRTFYHIADCYTSAAVAIYMQDHYDLDDPPTSSSYGPPAGWGPSLPPAPPVDMHKVSDPLGDYFPNPDRSDNAPLKTDQPKRGIAAARLGSTPAPSAYDGLTVSADSATVTAPTTPFLAPNCTLATATGQDTTPPSWCVCAGSAFPTLPVPAAASELDGCAYGTVPAQTLSLQTD